MKTLPTLLLFACWATALAGCPKDRPAGDQVFASADGGGMPASPRIHCADPVFEFGSAERGQAVRHTFQIQNQGQADLRIERVHGGSMIDAQALAKTVPPGGETGIEATLNTNTRLGRLKRTVTVYTNDPKRPQLQLAFGGVIEARLVLDPERLFLRQVPKGGRTTRTVKLAGREKAGVKLSTPAVNRPELSARIVSAGDEPAVEVTFQAGLAEGRFSGQVTVDTSHPQQPKLVLPVAATVTGDLVIDKRVATFAPPAAGRASVVLLNVSSLSGQAFQITRVEDPAGAVSGKVEATSQGQRVSLRLDKAPAKTTGTLRLHTDRKDQALIEIGYLIRAPHTRKPGRPDLQPGQRDKPALRPIGIGKNRQVPPLSVRNGAGAHGLRLEDEHTPPRLKSPPPGAQSLPPATP